MNSVMYSYIAVLSFSPPPSLPLSSHRVFSPSSLLCDRFSAASLAPQSRGLGIRPEILAQDRSSSRRPDIGGRPQGGKCKNQYKQDKVNPRNKKEPRPSMGKIGAPRSQPTFYLDECIWNFPLQFCDRHAKVLEVHHASKFGGQGP